MRHDEQVRQLQLMIDRLDNDVNVDAGGLRLNPTDVYTDPSMAKRERQLFFAEHTQLAGLSGDLREPGSFLTIDDLAMPVLCTRDGAGVFHAFVNSCRHRGVVVETRGRGMARRFVCPFHSWTYNAEGALVGLPKQDHFGDVDLSCHGLVELPSEERDGLLWFHPDPNGVVDVEAMLTPELSDELAQYDLGSLQYLGHDMYTVDCNWKLAMDTFGETYHFTTLHKDTLALGFHGNVQCYDTFGRNHRMLLCRRNIDEMRHLPEAQWDVRVGTLPVYWLFPNVQLMPSEFGLYLVRAYPDAERPGRHTSQITFYLRPEIFRNKEAVEGFREVSMRFASVIRDEDYVVSASQQRSAEGGALPHVVFGRNEPALHHFHGTYRAELGLEPLPLLQSV
jgi:phenylpropionate dioxygenase-like ring-hydroxylating dioxygenase large terminal subunit